MIYLELFDWANEEFKKGNRVKANKIYKVANKIKFRYDKYWEKVKEDMFY